MQDTYALMNLVLLFYISPIAFMKFALISFMERAVAVEARNIRESALDKVEIAPQLVRLEPSLPVNRGLGAWNVTEMYARA